ncbi:MAG: cytochrome C, partial [Xenococcaceae cyanobacterium]
MKVSHFFSRQKWLRVCFIIVGIASIFFSKDLALAQPHSGGNNIQLGQELYLQNCSSCHIPIAAEVLPTDTWRALLSNPQKHYG